MAALEGQLSVRRARRLDLRHCAAGWLGLCILLGAPSLALARDRFDARVTHVIDGDTLWVRMAPGDATARDAAPHTQGDARGDLGTPRPYGGTRAPREGRREPGQRLKLRLHGIDAPEACQPHGREATAVLRARTLGQRVEVERRAIDNHGRIVATLWLDGRDIASGLVVDGHAWSAGYRDKPGPYASQEAAARRAGRGLFATPAPEPPRSFRQRHGPCA